MSISLTESLGNKYLSLAPYLNERSRRIWAATESRELDHGGMKIIRHITGLSYPTIKKGIDELKLEESERVDASRLRKEGGGRKKNIIKDRYLTQNIKDIVESSTRGDPESPLLWSSKSTRKFPMS